MITFKNIKNNGKTFLLRFSKQCKTGSIKVHIILDDDVKPHTHPWDFKSIILFGGYNETTFTPIAVKSIEKGQMVDSTTTQLKHTKTYGLFSINEKKMDVIHLVQLRRLFGFKVPAITIGRYGEKKQLCSLCQELGYCRSKGKPAMLDISNNLPEILNKLS